MAGMAQVIGTKSVVRNLKRRGVIVGKGTATGLKQAGLFLQRESQLVVPVQLGNLKNSAYTRARGQGFTTVVRVGYTAGYAIYVHEDMNARHNPGQTAKFLQRPAREKRSEILRLIAMKARASMKGGR